MVRPRCGSRESGGVRRMFWREDEKGEAYRVPDAIRDLSFRVKGKSLPVDHAYALCNEVLRVLPWAARTEDMGIHAIHVAASGNGWHRPEGGADDAWLYLSRRTRLRLRLPKERLGDAEALTGATLNLGGHEIEVGAAEVRPLSALTTLFSRYVVAEAGEGEQAFLQRAAERLRRDFGIRARKLLCGRETRFRTPEGSVFSRSLMLAEIGREDSVRLQERGLGPHRLMGCGLFIPHKGVAPVNASADEYTHHE